MRALVWQGEGGFAGEDLHRLAHRRLGPLLEKRGPGLVRVEHASGPVRDAVARCAAAPGERPDVLVLPAFRRDLWESLAAIAELARVAPEVTVILSGWGARPEYLDAIGAELDHPRLALSLGEPEEALADALELLAGPAGGRGRPLPRPELSGLGLALPAAGGGWESPGRFRVVEDLGALPSVYGEGSLEPAELSGLALVEVSRGCRNRCAFCLSGNFERGRVRLFPAPRVAEEIERAARLGASRVALLCSALNHDVDVLEAAADAVEAAPGPLGVESTVHVSSLDDRRLAALRRLPWHRMIVGLQTLTPEAARLIGRPADPRRFRRAVLRLAAFHEPVVELILGLPGDGLEGFLRTVRFALDLPAHVEVYPLRLDPGSELMARRAELGLEADFSAAGRGRVVATPSFPARDLERAVAALDLLARRPDRLRAPSLGYDFRRLFGS